MNLRIPYRHRRYDDSLAARLRLTLHAFSLNLFVIPRCVYCQHYDYFCQGHFVIASAASSCGVLEWVQVEISVRLFRMRTTLTFPVCVAGRH